MAGRKDDKQLDELLKKDSPLARAYREIGHDDPPAALDARILAEARAAISAPKRGGKPPWLMPLALAATVVLSVGVVMFMARQGAGPLPPEALPVPDTKTTPGTAEKAPGTTPKAAVTPKQAPVAAPPSKPRFEARDVVIPAKVKTPEQWLAEIEALRKAGKQAEAEAELAEFRRRYPEYPLPTSGGR